MSRLPKFDGSKIPPPTCIPKPGISQQKVVEFKGPEQKLVTAKLNKAVQAANVPKMAAALKSSMSRRTPSVAEFRRPLGGVKSRPMARATATQSATIQKKPVKRTGVPLNAVKPKLVKQTPPKAKPKPAVKPAPYDYKARFGLLKETHEILKTNHSSLKEKFIDQSDENEVLSTANEQLKLDLEKAQSELVQFKAKCDRFAIENSELKACLSLAERELEVTKLDLHNTKSAHADCDIKFAELSVNLSKTATELNTTREELITAEQLIAVLKLQMHCLDVEKRRLHNDMQEMKGNIRVFCRVRPSLVEEQHKPLCNIDFLDENSIALSKNTESMDPSGRLRTTKADFTFDKVFTNMAAQETVFEELAQLVQSALDGYNVCVFAYGQTGSGKTYTMEGGSANDTMGMIPRAIDLIFQSFLPLERLGWKYSVRASFLEIYNENIVDLLCPKNGGHDIRMTDAKGTDVYVTNLTIQPIESAEQLKDFMKIAQQNRAVAATENNERSSRSHSVAKIHLEAVNEERHERCTGSLNLIDLAGSERVHTIGTNPRLNETKSINKSLSSLGNVILALVQKQDHIPYRNSKLTHILMPCLGGNSKTLMLVNIAPFEDCYHESVNSLRFASTVNRCRTGLVKRNKTLHSSTLSL
ncbi:non-claret disjunctional [Carabus blaptoides fortunei]